MLLCFDFVRGSGGSRDAPIYGTDFAFIRGGQPYVFLRPGLLHGLVWGAPAIIFSLVPSNLLRTEGLAKESMTGNMIGTVVNIILDPLFIFGLNMALRGGGGHSDRQCVRRCFLCVGYL